MTQNVRQATLVLIDSSSVVRGAIGPLELSVPWWQEIGPIVDVLPGAIVLRLLEAETTRTDEMGGRAVYLVQFDGPLPQPFEFWPWPNSDVVDDHPLRLPWARVGGPTNDLGWVASHVELDPSRQPRQERTWNLSAIWSIPVLADSGPSRVWLKCVPPFFSHEPAVLDLMADQPLPELLAAEGHRMLLAEMSGHDGLSATEVEEPAMVDALVDLQLTSVGRVDELLAAGVPDLRNDRLVAELGSFIDRLAADDAVLQPFAAGLKQRMARVEAHGLPDVLAHGDPHGGNCRLGVTPPMWFDWGDSFIGNPLLDVAALHRMSAATVEHWLNRWADAVPGSDPHQVWRLLEPVALLRMAWVYQRFCDNIEPTERVYHQRDVGEYLDEVRQSLAP